MFRKLHSEESGFTLIELVVTATFVATIATIAVEVFVSVGKINRLARNLSVATQLAQQKIEIDRNAGYNAIPATEDFSSVLPANFGAPKSATATFSDMSPIQPGLKQLDITITWKDAGNIKKVKVSTLITQRGIDR